MSNLAPARSAKLDNIKAILIILVVMGHVCNDITFFGSKELNLIIYSFHMPAFVFVSGLLTSSNKYKPKQLVSTLLYPFLIIQVILALLAIHVMKFGDPFSTVRPVSVAWYLLSMFFWRAMVPFVDTDNKKHAAIIIGVGIFLGLIAGFDANITDVMSVSRTICYFPFFYGGYFVKKFGVSFFNTPTKAKKAVSLVLALLCAGLMILFSDHLVVEWGWNMLPYSHYQYDYNVWMRACYYVISGIWIMFLFMWVPSVRIKFLTTVGERTMPIYLLHRLFCSGSGLLAAAVPLVGAHPFINFCVTTVVCVVVLASKPATTLVNYAFFPPSRWPSRKAKAKAKKDVVWTLDS